MGDQASPWEPGTGSVRSLLNGAVTTIALVVLAPGVLAACAGHAAPPSAASPMLGKPLPDIQRKGLDGASAQLDGDERGPVVVKFFAKYCEPCRKTLPEAQAISESSGGVTVIGISEDELESDARAVVKEYGLTFPVIHDRGRVLAGRFRVTDLPASFVASRGRVVWVGGPEQTAADLAAAVREAEALGAQVSP